MSFCLDSRLLASFLVNVSDLYNLSMYSRALVPFRSQIRRIKHKQTKWRCPLTVAITNGRLPCLSELEIDFLSITWTHAPPLLTFISAGVSPSLKTLHLRIRELSEWHGTGDVLRLMALPDLERLEVIFHRFKKEQVHRLFDELDRYPKVRLMLAESDASFGYITEIARIKYNGTWRVFYGRGWAPQN